MSAIASGLIPSVCHIYNARRAVVETPVAVVDALCKPLIERTKSM